MNWVDWMDGLGGLYMDGWKIDGWMNLVDDWVDGWG